jgi:hypothetical protein
MPAQRARVRRAALFAMQFTLQPVFVTEYAVSS